LIIAYHVLVSDKTSAKTKSSGGKVIFSIIIVAIIIAIAVSFYFYIQYQKAQKLLQNPTLVASEETRSLIAKVSNLIELPKGEDPIIATVSDINKLKDQPFFANAQNGDKVLIYEKAREAILYRPSINKIIQVAPVSTTVHP
jgi:flagellar basal body-associated protein FliL